MAPSMPVPSLQAREEDFSSRCRLPASPVQVMGPWGIKLSTADLAALSRAILETPTSRGDDAPAALRSDPPRFLGQNSVRRVDLQWCDELHMIAACCACNRHYPCGWGLKEKVHSNMRTSSETRRHFTSPCSGLATAFRHRAGIVGNQTPWGDEQIQATERGVIPCCPRKKQRSDAAGPCSVPTGRESAQPICSAASSSCQRLYYTQTTGNIGPILDQHPVEPLHTQLFEPLTMLSALTPGFVGLFRRIITESASEIAGLGSAAQGATFGPVFSVGKLDVPAAWTHVVDY